METVCLFWEFYEPYTYTNRSPSVKVKLYVSIYQWDAEFRTEGEFESSVLSVRKRTKHEV